MTQTFALYVDDKAGVLNRVVSLFRRRMLNIESLTAGRSEIPGVSRMTVVVDTDEYGAHRLAANLNKLMAVRRVDRLASESSISTELALIKVAMPEDARTEVNRFLDAHRARIVSAHPDRLVIETTGTSDEIDGVLTLLRPYGVVEVVRTGRVAMADARRAGRQPVARALPAVAMK